MTRFLPPLNSVTFSVGTITSPKKRPRPAIATRRNRPSRIDSSRLLCTLRMYQSMCSDFGSALAVSRPRPPALFDRRRRLGRRRCLDRRGDASAAGGDSTVAGASIGGGTSAAAATSTGGGASAVVGGASLAAVGGSTGGRRFGGGGGGSRVGGAGPAAMAVFRRRLRAGVRLSQRARGTSLAAGRRASRLLGRVGRSRHCRRSGYQENNP